MKAIRVHARARPAAFTYEDAARPVPGEGEVLVGVHAAAVTPTELEWAPTWTARTGEPRPFPIILGHEFSGEICAVGPGVTDWAPGEAVFGINDWFRDGAQAEYCVARGGKLINHRGFRRADSDAARPRCILHRRGESGPAPRGRTLDRRRCAAPSGAVFPLAQARQAYEYKPPHGKVVLRVRR